MQRVQCCRKLLDSQNWKKQSPCPTHSCLEGSCRAMYPSSAPSQGWEPCSCHPHEPVHACTVSLQILQTTSCHLIPVPTMLYTWGCNKKFNHHLKDQFTFKMHFHSALCPPHRWLQVDAGSLHLCFTGNCSSQYSVDCRDEKKMPRKLLVSHTFLLCGLLHAGGSQTHIIPSALCAPMPELETLQHKECRFSSSGRAVPYSKAGISSVLSWYCGW